MPKRPSLFDAFLAGVRAPVTRANLDEYEDIGALYLLTGDERTAAEDILIDKLREDDGRAAKALADIGCTRAIPALAERAAHSEWPTMRVWAADALLRMGDHSGRAALAEVARTGDWYDRAAAVDLLVEYPGEDTEAVVRAAMTDPNSTTRSSAVSAFLTLRGLGGYDDSSQDLLGNIVGRMCSPLVSVQEEARGELWSVLERRAAGETPEQLGLTEPIDVESELFRGFVASLRDDPTNQAEDYDLTGLAELSGRERKWVEDMLLNYLPRDPRAIRAVARFGVRRAIEPLREMLPTADPATATQIEAALRHLTGEG
jgi:HEAT repeat protein